MKNKITCKTMSIWISMSYWKMYYVLANYGVVDLFAFLNPKRARIFWLSKSRGGWINPQQFSRSCIANFHANQPKHHLKWKLASLSACRVFEHHSKLHSFAVRWRRSSLLWPRKFSSFRYHNFWKFVIFDLHGQYVHQMKAENILNANLT